MPRPAAVVLGWVAATAAAIAVAYAGVSAVAGGVVEPLPATVGQPPAVSGPATASPTSEDRSSDDQPTPSDTATATPDDTTPSPTSAPVTGIPAPTVAPTAQPSPDEEVAPPPAEVRSYSLVGGSATLRFEPGRVTVVSAEPAQGFSYDIEGNGTAEVRVEFESDDHRSRLKGSWEGGPRERIEEDADTDDGGDDVDEVEDD